MFVRPTYVWKNGQRDAYWRLVESYRTERGPRQRTVAYLGQIDEAGRLGVRDAVEPRSPSSQRHLFAESETEPRFVEIDRTRVRVENCRQFGGPWLALELIKKLGLHEFLKRALPAGQEHVPWSLTALILVIARLCEPSSELYIAEHFYRQSALGDLLGVPIDKVDENRLYRGLDQLLPHKAALETFLKDRFGELFASSTTCSCMTSPARTSKARRTRIPGAARLLARSSPRLQAGVHRPGGDALRLPLGYEVFAGNRHDSTTLEEIVETMEARYGKAQRIWVLDRGMVSEDNIDFEAGRAALHRGNAEVPAQAVRAAAALAGLARDPGGSGSQLCPCPEGSEETFFLCRSRDRREKEQAMHARFEKRIEEGLAKIAAGCGKRRQQAAVIERRVGRLLGQNTRAAGLFDVQVRADRNGHAQITWKKIDRWREWAQLSEGSYVLRSNVRDWSDQELWRAYIQLTEAEAAFRIQKSDLSIRPVWHQKEDRVEAHILVCFLAYVLWKFLGQLCQKAGLGDEPRAAGRIQRTPCGRRHLADERRPRVPHGWRYTAERPSENPPESFGPGTPRPLALRGIVVQKLRNRPLRRNHLRQSLGKLG